MGELHAVLDLGYSPNMSQLYALRNNYVSGRPLSKPLFLLVFLQHCNQKVVVLKLNSPVHLQ